MSNLTRRSFIGVGAAAAAAAALAGCSSGGSGSASSASASASSASASASGSASSASASSAASASASASQGTGAGLRFVTGGESGTYYALGTIMAQHANNNAGLDITAVSSDGSKANVLEIDDGAAQLAFCQSDVASYAYEGSTFEDFEGMPIANLTTVASLYEEQVQIITCDSSIKTVADLKGKNVSIGAAGSGVYFNAIDVLGAYDLTEKDITPTYQSFQDSTDALKDGKIDAAFIVAGAPTSAVTDLTTTKDAYLVAIDSEHAKKLIEKSKFYNEATIPADTYTGTAAAETTTVSVDSLVLAADSVSEDDVYAFVSDVFENLKELEGSNAKFAEFNLEKAASYSVVPYHPGAVKYFDEKGVAVAAK